jgi:cytochrome c oxidase cbb3-type subunit IV
MYKEVLRSIEGIEIYPIISLLIFFVFFVGMAAWFFAADRERLRRASLLPLDAPASAPAQRSKNR